MLKIFPKYYNVIKRIRKRSGINKFIFKPFSDISRENFEEEVKKIQMGVNNKCFNLANPNIKSQTQTSLKLQEVFQRLNEMINESNEINPLDRDLLDLYKKLDGMHNFTYNINFYFRKQQKRW